MNAATKAPTPEVVYMGPETSLALNNPHAGEVTWRRVYA